MERIAHYGLIIRHLRMKSQLSVRKCSEKIGRSTGWLSEIENECGTARLTETEFLRIVKLLDGERYRDQFKTWIASNQKMNKTDRTFDGAILKHVRMKKEWTLRRASVVTGISIARLSKMERGQIRINLDLRNQIMSAYGYSPSSFKNFSKDPERAKAVPVRFKLAILLEGLSVAEITELYETAVNRFYSIKAV